MRGPRVRSGAVSAEARAARTWAAAAIERASALLVPGRSHPSPPPLGYSGVPMNHNWAFEQVRTQQRNPSRSLTLTARLARPLSSSIRSVSCSALPLALATPADAVWTAPAHSEPRGFAYQRALAGPQRVDPCVAAALRPLTRVCARLSQRATGADRPLFLLQSRSPATAALFRPSSSSGPTSRSTLTRPTTDRTLPSRRSPLPTSTTPSPSRASPAVENPSSAPPMLPPASATPSRRQS